MASYLRHPAPAGGELVEVLFFLPGTVKLEFTRNDIRRTCWVVSSSVPRKEMTRSLVSCTVSNLSCSKEVQMDTDADGHSGGSRIH